MTFAPTLGRWTQRLLPIAAALGVASIVPASHAAPDQPAAPDSPPVFAYVGTYAPNGQGVYLLRQDPQTGALQQVGVYPSVPNPAQFAISKDTLYVGSESPKHGEVAAYAIDRRTGALTLRNQVDAQGKQTVYLGLINNQRQLLVANYGSGSVALFALAQDGSLGAASDVHQSVGQPGAAHPAAAVEGSFAASDHNGPHAHMIAADPSGQFAFSTDLGLDRIYQWRIDAEHGKLLPNDPPFINASSAGAGPRHFVFGADGKQLYLVNEEASTLTHYRLDTGKGTLTEAASLSTLPPGFKGTSFASDILITPDGRFVYVLNRLHDSIARFAVAADGSLSWQDDTWTRGSYPRTLTLDPTGRFIYVANQRSDHIATFKLDAASGKVEFTGQYTPVGAPSQLIFLR